MLKFRIQLDVKPVLTQLDNVTRQQLPFATALALTRTGLDGQQAERDRLASVFTLRRPDFILKQGVKLLPPGIATKTRPSISFGIDAKASFLEKFELGTTKIPTRGEFLALPFDVKKNKKDLITPSNRPRAIVSRLGNKPGAGGVFVLRTQRGKLAPGIYQRTGRGGRSVKELYDFDRSAHTPRVLAFVDTFTKTAEQRWAKNFEDAFAQAVRTAT
jgi:hypothetical protein